MKTPHLPRRMPACQHSLHRILPAIPGAHRVFSGEQLQPADTDSRHQESAQDSQFEADSCRHMPVDPFDAHQVPPAQSANVGFQRGSAAEVTLVLDVEAIAVAHSEPEEALNHVVVRLDPIAARSLAALVLLHMDRTPRAPGSAHIPRNAGSSEALVETEARAECFAKAPAHPSARTTSTPTADS